MPKYTINIEKVLKIVSYLGTVFLFVFTLIAYCVLQVYDVDLSKENVNYFLKFI